MVNNKSVAQYTLEGKLVQIFESVIKARQTTGIDNSHIGKVASGKVKSFCNKHLQVCDFIVK